MQAAYNLAVGWNAGHPAAVGWTLAGELAIMDDVNKKLTHLTERSLHADPHSTFTSPD